MIVQRQLKIILVSLVRGGAWDGVVRMAESKIGIGGWMWVGNACRQIATGGTGVNIITKDEYKE